MGGAVAAIIAAKTREIVEAFRVARATSVTSGRSLADIRLEDSRIFRGLLRRGLIHEASPGTYYLDEAAYEADRKRRLTLALVLAGAVLIFGIFFALYARP